jgi:glutamate-5-semialdehyde dehydrogenase
MEQLITDLAKRSLEASRFLATLPTEKKNDVLGTLADFLEANTDGILEENAKDLAEGEAKGLSSAMIDRLRFTPDRIKQMADGVRQIIDLPDPVGEIIEEHKHENGMVLSKVRVPIGVIGIIFESRPNVTIDCAALCFKSGNAAILRGGSEAFHSNTILANIIAEALEANDIDPACVQMIPTTDRAATSVLLKLDQYVNCVIPRGGEGLIRAVTQQATMPVIKHYKGVCSLFVEETAKPEMAVSVAVNAKCQRPGVCNAIENLFIQASAADTLLPEIAKELVAHKVELRAEPKAKAILEKANIACIDATEEDFFEEYIDLILSVKVVESTEEAIQCINKYGSGHSDAIVSENHEAAEKFLNGVDASTVYWNASTRFTDGYEFGLGAEIGISTDKLHARGPMGLRELTTYKFKVVGTGQIRG